VLSPGGIAVILLLPAIGILISKMDARYMIAFGFGVTSIGLFHFSRLTLDISFSEAMWSRVLQAAGIAFLFIPIQTVAYIGMAREKSNAISGITNLARNIGGSVGISFVTTFLARRAQYHQSSLSGHMGSSNPAFQGALNGATNNLLHNGSTASAASHQAYGLLYNTLGRQATFLAYMDTFWILAVGSAILVPCVFLMRKARATQVAAH
jgi:MFS transporter, DHA2 family, multidrug resistance protein